MLYVSVHHHTNNAHHAHNDQHFCGFNLIKFDVLMLKSSLKLLGSIHVRNAGNFMHMGISVCCIYVIESSFPLLSVVETTGQDRCPKREQIKMFDL